MSAVHPSAVGSATQPNTGTTQGNPEKVSVDSQPSTTAQPNTAEPTDSEGYPEQKHAGKVGYGPNYHQGPGFEDKLNGLKEEIKGKITRNPGLVEHGKEQWTGELKRKEREEDLNPSDDPFASPDEKKKSSPTDTERPHETAAKEQAATVAPHGTDAAETQRKGEAVDNVKHIG